MKPLSATLPRTASGIAEVVASRQIRSVLMDSVEEDLLDGLKPAERSELEALLTSIWERSGGYDAWTQAAEPESQPA
jgi:hypothetical protein